MKTARLLIVENSPLLATLLPMQLAKHGFQVVAQAATGEDAVLKAAHTPLDLVLMDIDLDGEMDGIAAAEAICKTQDVPILFTTSHSGQDIQKRLHAAGPAACILKPFTEKELAIAIEFRLFRHQSERLQQEMNAEIQRLTQRLETLDSQAKPGA